MILFAEMDSPSDREFMEQTYSAYFKKLFSVAKHYVAEDSVAEDVVQDSFVKLISKVQLLRSFNRAKLRAYLISTVRNTAITKSQKQSAERAMQFLGDLENAQIDDTDNISPEEILVNAELQSAFSSAMERLGERDRYLLEAKYYLGLSDSEIAKALGVKAASVRTIIMRARQKVLNTISEEMNDNG